MLDCTVGFSSCLVSRPVCPEVLMCNAVCNCCRQSLPLAHTTLAPLLLTHHKAHIVHAQARKCHRHLPCCGTATHQQSNKLQHTDRPWQREPDAQGLGHTHTHAYWQPLTCWSWKARPQARKGIGLNIPHKTTTAPQEGQNSHTGL